MGALVSSLPNDLNTNNDTQQRYTFDVIGELFFGRMFGFLRERKDIGGYIAAVDIILPHAIRVAVLPKLLWPLQILDADLTLPSVRFDLKLTLLATSVTILVGKAQCLSHGRN